MAAATTTIAPATTIMESSTDSCQRQQGQQRRSEEEQAEAEAHSSRVSAAMIVSPSTISAATLHTVLGIPAQMELSQIELIYRAEGNANLVLALPQFKKVLRLPKMLLGGVQHQHQLEQRQQLHLPQSASVRHEHQSAAGKELTMEDFVAYIEIIRRLLGSEHIFRADVVRIPSEDDRSWLNAHIRPHRPAQRLDKEFLGQFGLLLPDATQLPAAFDVLLSNLQPKATLTGDTFAIEIKPKQGWLLPSDVSDLFHIKPATQTAATTTATTRRTATATAPTPPAVVTTTATTPEARRSIASKVTKTDTRCRYCAMQFLKLKNGKVSRLSAYCPIELFSGEPSRMLAALHALFACPQNNLRVFRNGNLIYGDHSDSISWQDLTENVFKGDTLQLIKQLLVTCLLRDYDGGAAATAAGADVVVEAVAGQPHPRATPTQPNETMAKQPETDTRAQINELEMLCLPKNCVLHRILHLQLLVKRHLRSMSEAGFAGTTAKTYDGLGALLNSLHEISFDNLLPAEAYLLGATALDCSVLVAFREISSTALSVPRSPYIVHVPEHKKAYLTKVTLLDLDPKPDSHFSKYVRQTKEAQKYYLDR